jgi:hypothetical protein
MSLYIKIKFSQECCKVKIPLKKISEKVIRFLFIVKGIKVLLSSKKPGIKLSEKSNRHI